MLTRGGARLSSVLALLPHTGEYDMKNFDSHKYLVQFIDSVLKDKHDNLEDRYIAALDLLANAYPRVAYAEGHDSDFAAAEDALDFYFGKEVE